MESSSLPTSMSSSLPTDHLQSAAKCWTSCSDGTKPWLPRKSSQQLSILRNNIERPWWRACTYGWTRTRRTSGSRRATPRCTSYSPSRSFTCPAPSCTRRSYRS